ncbi:MAG: riboflavin synthase, partial [Cyanobacteria bacterium NC_groundwater_1444_Ag_S-0.65um_54_12]|nr:riboflavin synthase [Cyanobacteria bacterium NC_groundwater_1444_Ag_S-0.65um_54_12]
MFTGLVQETGTLIARSSNTLTISADCASKLTLGESIAVQGVCLTVTRVQSTTFAVAISATTLRFTTVGSWSAGHFLNLERALALGDRLGGHIVTGHSDGVGRLLRKEKLDHSLVYWFEISDGISGTLI